MKITGAEFISSNTKLSSCPKPVYPEYAFTGRSNVGKSSLINALTSQKSLAKTSSTPGKTQLINHFLINKNNKPWYLVDLPGYGYARTLRSESRKWHEFMEKYLKSRDNLLCTFVLVDCRHEPQKIDLEFMVWLNKNEIPFVIIFTKTDKLTPVQLQKNMDNYARVMLKDWEEMPQYFTCSSHLKSGIKQVLDFIGETNLLFKSIT